MTISQTRGVAAIAQFEAEEFVYQDLAESPNRLRLVSKFSSYRLAAKRSVSPRFAVVTNKS